MLAHKVQKFWKFTSNCSLKPLWSGIPSHCASIVVTSSLRVNQSIPCIREISYISSHGISCYLASAPYGSDTVELECAWACNWLLTMHMKRTAWDTPIHKIFVTPGIHIYQIDRGSIEWKVYLIPPQMTNGEKPTPNLFISSLTSRPVLSHKFPPFITGQKSHYPPAGGSGDNQSEKLSTPVVSKWLWPGNRTFFRVALHGG